MPPKPPKKVDRENSPALIAAKEAPGWEKFLGGKSNFVQFTSAEVDKLRKKKTSTLETHFDYSEEDGKENGVLIQRLRNEKENFLKPIHASKSSPSLDKTLQSPQRTWLKNSLDGLDRATTSEPVVANAPTSPSRGKTASNNNHHSHSHSDSGLSSISSTGRASTMSPVSTMSTTSSVSSNGSLRSASIVSSCTIPLDEEEEEEEEDVGEERRHEERDDDVEIESLAEELVQRIKDEKTLHILG